MTPQEELQALRRLAELEAKAAGTEYKPVSAPTNSNVLKGVGEAALSLGTGAVAAPVGGIVGLAAASTPFLREGIGADISSRIGQAGTYAPRSEPGKKIVNAIAAPFEWLANKADIAGEKVSDATGSPLLGTVVNTGIQALPFGASKVISKLSKAETAADIALRDKAKIEGQLYNEGTLAAKDAGYALPPAQVNPSRVNSILQGIAGSGKLNQAASIKNQAVTNNLIRKAFEIPDNEPLSRDALASVRKKAGDNYDVVRGVGEIAADADYLTALSKIKADAELISSNFPKRGKPEIIGEIDAINVPKFDSAASVAVIKDLRNSADKAFRSGDKKLGSDYKSAATAIEDLIERNLIAKNAPAEIVNNFRDARRLIAQTYTVEKHLSSDGNINAVGLALELKKKPLTGDIATVAKFGEQFKKAAQRPENIAGVAAISPTALGVSGLMAAITQNPAYLLATGVPPVMRAAMLSKAYQNALVRPPSYGPSITNRLIDAASNEKVNNLLNIQGMSEAQQERR